MRRRESEDGGRGEREEKGRGMVLIFSSVSLCMVCIDKST